MSSLSLLVGKHPHARGSLKAQALRMLVALIVPGVLTVLVSGLAVMAAIWGIGEVARSSADVSDRIFPLAQQSKDVQQHVIQVQQWLTDVSATRGMDGLGDGFDKAREAAARFETDSSRLLERAREIGAGDLEEAVEKARRSFPPYLATGERMARAYVAGGPASGNKMMTEFDQVSERIQEDLRAIDRIAGEMVARRIQSVSDAQGRGETSGFVALAASLVTATVGLVVALRVGSSVRKAGETMSRAADILRRASGGDLNSRVVGIDRDDEIGQLLRNANRLLDSTEVFAKEAHAAVSAASNGDYYRQIFTTGFRGDFIRYADSINHVMNLMERQDSEKKGFCGEFDGAVADVTSGLGISTRLLECTAQEMSNLSAQVTAQAVTVAAASQQAAVNVQTVAAATGQLSGAVADIGRRVAESNDMVRSAVAEAGQTDVIMRELSDAVTQIGDVVNLISEIAGQTNLLALNATIEAARAGETGKGFAVVAGEVKNLASQTARATQQIGGQIASVQSGAARAVEAIRTISATIARIDEIASAIARSVEEQATSTREISRNIEQASSGTREVSENIASINQAAEHAGTASLTVLDSAKTLSEEASALEKAVSSFRARMQGAAA